MTSIFDGIPLENDDEQLERLIRYNTTQSRRMFLTASSWLATIGFAYLVSVGETTNLTQVGFMIFFALVTAMTHANSKEKEQ